MLKVRGARGQLEISFGMIFSIILIIAVVAVAFYVIQYFMKLSTCSGIGLFYEGLQEETDTAWAGSSSRTLFHGQVPSSVDYICFGNMSLNPANADRERFEELKRAYRLRDSNVFVYPQKKNCGELSARTLQHARMSEFFCVRADSKNIVEISLTKETFDNLVSVGKK